MDRNSKALENCDCNPLNISKTFCACNDFEKHDISNFLHPEILQFSPEFGPCLNLMQKLREKENPVEKTPYSSGDAAQKKCRFLSLVVVERVMMVIDLVLRPHRPATE